MKAYQNIFHGTVISVLVVSGIGLIATLLLFIGVGVTLIVDYPKGVWPHLFIAGFMTAVSSLLFGGIYEVPSVFRLPR